MRRWSERALADFGVVTKTGIEVIVENNLTKVTNMLKMKIIKTVQSTFKGALHAI